MLSYQHAYHAGNNADCHKHSLLAALIERLKKDPAPFCYIDTHAGRGMYDLYSDEIQKLAEYRRGVQKLWADPSWPRDASAYKRALQSLNRGAKMIRFYPGSPWIAEAGRRPQDDMILFELHPQEYKNLFGKMKMLDRVTIEHDSGWIVVDETVTTISRGIIMIDPSFELKDEYDLMAERMQSIAENYPNFIIALWYPILSEPRHKDMTAALEALHYPSLKSEIMFDTDKGMIGSGMFILRPPENFNTVDAALHDWLKKSL